MEDLDKNGLILHTDLVANPTKPMLYFRALTRPYRGLSSVLFFGLYVVLLALSVYFLDDKQLTLCVLRMCLYGPFNGAFPIEVS